MLFDAANVTVVVCCYLLSCCSCCSATVVGHICTCCGYCHRYSWPTRPSAVALWLSLLMPSLLLRLLTKTLPLDNHCQQNLFPHLADFRPFMFDPIKVPKENGVEGIRIQVGLSLLRHREL